LLQKPASNIAEEHKITLIIYESKNASFISNIENARKKRFPASKKRRKKKFQQTEKKDFQQAKKERKKNFQQAQKEEKKSKRKPHVLSLSSTKKKKEEK
jgi:hypothetical protein